MACEELVGAILDPPRVKVFKFIIHNNEVNKLQNRSFAEQPRLFADAIVAYCGYRLLEGMECCGPFNSLCCPAAPFKEYAFPRNQLCRTQSRGIRTALTMPCVSGSLAHGLQSASDQWIQTLQAEFG